MFGRISNSWQLVKASWNVLRADKELIVFPIVSLFGAILVTLTFVVPSIFAGVFSNLAEGETSGRIIAGIVAFLFYVTLYTVIFYCNTALVGAALIRLKGGDPTLSDGFRIANEHLGSIFVYSLISATVGMILRWIRDKGILGRLAAGLVGMAWNLATYFVVPILVTQKVSPIEAVKRSAALLKKTWGEQVVGNLSIGAVTGLLIFGTLLVGTVLSIVLMGVAGWVGIASACLFILVAIAIGLVSSALSGIYTAAVFQYASTGDSGTFFDSGLIRDAFRVK